MTMARVKDGQVVQIGLPASVKNQDQDTLHKKGWRVVKGTPKPTEGSGYEYKSPYTYDAQEDAVYGTWQQTDIHEQIEKERRESASLSRADFKLGLLEMGELDNVQALMDDPATEPRIKIMWEDSGRFERMHPDLLQLAEVMGYTETKLDMLFGIIGGVNVNEASKEELIELDDIGSTLAQKIIDGRPWNNVNDLTSITGISQTMVDGLPITV